MEVEHVAAIRLGMPDGVKRPFTNRALVRGVLRVNPEVNLSIKKGNSGTRVIARVVWSTAARRKKRP